MKAIFAALAATVIGATPAFSQSSTTVTTTAPGASHSITLAPEQRTKIKQYVVQEKVKPFAAKERFAVGATLPADVELLAVPSDWGPEVRQYRYVYSNNNVIFVDPSSRRVVQIID